MVHPLSYGSCINQYKYLVDEKWLLLIESIRVANDSFAVSDFFFFFGLAGLIHENINEEIDRQCNENTIKLNFSNEKIKLIEFVHEKLDWMYYVKGQEHAIPHYIRNMNNFSARKE